MTKAPRGAEVRIAGLGKSCGRGESTLEGIDLTVQPGEFVALVGPSGCGKTTLLRLVAGLLALTRGQASIDGHPPTGARGESAFVLQEPTQLN